MEPLTPTEPSESTHHHAFPAPDPVSDDVRQVTEPIEIKPISPAGSRGEVDNSHPHFTLDRPSSSKSSLLNRVTDGMSWYGLELALSVVGLLVTTVIINYAIYALVNYAKGIDNPLAVRFLGEFSLWVAASMIIWLPLAVIFYLRTRAEIDRHPATKERLVHKLFVGYFLFNVVLAIAGTMFSVVYALIRMAVGIDDQASDTAVRTVLPGILAAAVNIGLFWAYGKHEGLSRKLFSMIIGGLGVIVTIALLAMSVSNVQGANRDEKAASDLSEIQSQMSSYYSSKRSLPNTLHDLEGLKTETKGRLSRYDYKKDAATKYQLCATFVTDTQKQQGYEASARYGNDDYYSSYASFSVHGTGEKCFKLKVGYSSYYDDILNGSGSNGSSLFDSPDTSSSY